MRRIRSAFLFLLLPVPFVLGSTPNSFRPRAIDWSDTVYVPAYPAGNALPLAVVLRYQRFTSAVGRVENLHDEPCGIIFTHRVRMQLGLAGGRVLDDASREGTETRFLSAFDGSDDFDGDSGDAVIAAGGDSTTLVLDDPADIAFFVGSGGVVALSIDATGQAEIASPKGVRQEIDVRAGVRVTVEYVTSGAP